MPRAAGEHHRQQRLEPGRAGGGVQHGALLALERPRDVVGGDLAMLPSRSCSQRPRCDSSSRIGGFTFAIVPSRATSVSLSPR